MPVALVTAAALMRCEYCAGQLGFTRDDAALAAAAIDRTGGEAVRLEAWERVGVLVPQRRLQF